MRAKHARITRYPLTVAQGLELRGVIAKPVRHRGRRALELTEDPRAAADTQALAVIRGSDFEDGEIRVRMAGIPAPDAPPEMRGFVGLAFHVQPGASAFEAFWLRPTNPRSDDQLRRNHSTQYASYPEYPWYRLREETPGSFESYVDLVPDAWTEVRVRVAGRRAELFVGKAARPCLLVKELKLEVTGGAIGLWIGRGTVAHFSDLIVVAW